MKEAIISYYNQSHWLYKLFWYNKSSLSLHFGIDDEKTKNLTQSQENQYKIIIKEGKIKKGMKVLDAGCGVGGASIYIAQKTKAETYGISLVPRQIKDANRIAKKKGLTQLTNFSVMDYAKTSFPDNYFDVVFAIESLCYSSPKESFLQEAKRVLKKSGKLIIADGYRIRKEQNKLELEITNSFCSGWKLTELIKESSMSQKIEKSGFKTIKKLDKTNNINLTKKRFRTLIFLGHLAPFLPGVRDNLLAMKSVLSGLKRGLFGYFIHIAGKK